MADEKRKYAVNGDELYKRYYSTTAQEPSLTGLYEQITQRPAFSYDVGRDPLYQQYRDRYVQQGQNAMRDTMGQAAALTGGYGSSYAQGVGQQTYDRYMQGLTDKIPELYSAAYSRYQDEGNRLMQQYSMAKDVENTAYSRQQSAYQRLYSLIGSTGYQPTDEELAAAGMPREVANRIRTLALLKNDTLNYIDANGNYIPPAVPETPVYYGGGGGGKKQDVDNAQYYRETVGELSQLLRNPNTNTSEVVGAIRADSTLTADQKEDLIRSMRSSGKKSNSMN